MAGLNNLISDTTQQATTLPSWMSAAQQDVVNRATQGAVVAPQTLSQTAAQPVVSQYGQAGSNPFLQAQGMLQQIGSGAANPWITDASGNVTPNTATPLGGLFAAQQQQLNQLLPNITAPATAQGIGTGQFGSLRSQTAIDKAKADALANLQTQQMTQALNAQQTGVQAGQALGNVGQQAVTGSTGLAALQQAAPFSVASNLGKTLSSMPAVPTTETKTAQLSPLSQAIALGGALQGGTAGLNSLINQISPGSSIGSLLSSVFGSSNPYAGNAAGTDITGTGSIGDISASQQYLPSGALNPNYDAYADPNATQAMIDAQNAAALQNVAQQIQGPLI